MISTPKTYEYLIIITSMFTINIVTAYTIIADAAEFGTAEKFSLRKRD